MRQFPSFTSVVSASCICDLPHSPPLKPIDSNTFPDTLGFLPAKLQEIRGCYLHMFVLSTFFFCVTALVLYLCESHRCSTNCPKWGRMESWTDRLKVKVPELQGFMGTLSVKAAVRLRTCPPSSGECTGSGGSSLFGFCADRLWLTSALPAFALSNLLFWGKLALLSSVISSGSQWSHAHASRAQNQPTSPRAEPQFCHVSGTFLIEPRLHGYYFVPRLRNVFSFSADTLYCCTEKHLNSKHGLGSILNYFCPSCQFLFFFLFLVFLVCVCFAFLSFFLKKCFHQWIG